MKKLRQCCQLEGHSDRVWYLAWSPSGDCFASCSGDKTVKIWGRRQTSADEDSWECLHTLEGSHTGTVRSCCWSPNGKYLATASFDKTVVIWTEFDGDWDAVAVLEGHDSEVKGVAWNPNGFLLATCGRDKTVWFWESQPQDEYDVVDVKHGHSQDVKAVRWHPSGEMLASVSYDDSIKLWMESDDEWICVKTLPGGSLENGHTSTVWDVCFHPDGRFMATCSDDCSIKIWSLRLSHEHVDCRLVKTLTGLHERTIYSVDWSDRYGLLATAGADNAIHILSVTDSEGQGQDGNGDVEVTVQVQLLQAHGQDVNCVRWRPQCSNEKDTWDGMLASASDDGTIILWRCS